MPEKNIHQRSLTLDEKDFSVMSSYWLGHRRLMVKDEITEWSTKKYAADLLRLDYLETAPILIMIRSDGGCVEATHQLEDTIDSLNSPVDTLAIGNCCSMAVDLLQMGKKRHMLRSAKLLVHYIRNTQHWICDDDGRLEKDFEIFRERVRAMGERRLELYKKRSGLSEERIKELFRFGEMNRDRISAEQAIALGLADEIITDFKFFPKPTETEK